MILLPRLLAGSSAGSRLTSEHTFDSVTSPFGPPGRKDPVLAEPLQTTLDLGVPLSEVTFCVLDLETTGGSPVDSRITEIGASLEQAAGRREPDEIRARAAELARYLDGLDVEYE